MAADDHRLHPSSGEPRSSYFAVPPTPGTLWLFPGSVPHTVMHTVLPEGVPEPATPRISIGINFETAVAPLARPWQPARPWAEQLMAARRKVERRMRQRLQAYLETNSPEAPRGACAEDGEEDEAQTAAAAASEEEERFMDAPQVAAAEEWAWAAKKAGDSPFLMLTPEEAKERGFRDDEELVMPMPVDESDED
jgi:hypothetical protein